MSLESVLRKSTPHQRSVFKARIRLLANESALGLQARINFEAECRIPESIWEEFIEAVITADPDPANIHTAIRNVMKNHILTGPPAQYSSGTIFGRAVSMKRLARSFVAHGYFGSPAAAHSHIRSLRTQNVAFLHRRWAKLYLGRFVMWGTFNPKGERPFKGMRPIPEEIMGQLGLAREDVGGPSNPLLIMEYTLPSNVTARIPRIVEAYAGEDWVYFFRPAPKEETSHGLTLPWDDLSSKSPLPEVVHEPVTGNFLVMPLWEIT